MDRLNELSRLLAVVGSSGLVFAATSHRGEPVSLSNASSSVVWTASAQPFGQAQVNEDPDNDGVFYHLNLRLPGQYYTAETGLHYNYFRFYASDLGRYLQADPVGINFTSTNLYAYTANDPLNFVDPFGLDLTPAQKAAIVSAAQNWWQSGVPYLLGGTTTSGADCSGAVSSIYQQAGIDIGRITSTSLPDSSLFYQVSGTPEVGDIGWTPGHVVIYGGDQTGVPNADVWSTTSTYFKPTNNSYFGGDTIWYRYK